jgi:hypothetical protein
MNGALLGGYVESLAGAAHGVLRLGHLAPDHVEARPLHEGPCAGAVPPVSLCVLEGLASAFLG